LDSALSASILRIANSTAYSRGRKFDSVLQAVSVIGAKATAAIALGFSLKQSIPSWSHPSGLSDVVLWRHSVATAVAGRTLARLVAYSEDQKAFLCGLLSRIGQLVLYTAAPEEYGKVLDQSPSLFPTSDCEREHCGISQHDVGYTLLEKWQLPAEICEVVRDWGGLLDSTQIIQTSPRDENMTLQAIVAVSDSVAELLSNEDKGVGLERTHTLAKELLQISEGEIERMFTSSEKELRETLAIFGDPHGAKIDCESILEEARQRLVLMSIGLATDLADANQNASNLEEANRNLQETADTDPLTGLPNRAALAKEAESVWATGGSCRTRHFAVLMVDVDHFKSFNDTYGHQVGDEVLIAVGNVLFDTARGTDFVARYGGEEFTVILTNAKSENVAAIAERFRAAVESMVVDVDGSESLCVTASFGVACSDALPNAKSFDDILEAADQALYEAKHAGRNCARVSTEASAASPKTAACHN
jgi:diguanylate cyclase (GGDEF)-like protein